MRPDGKKPIKIVIVNQATNYLTIGFANAFFARCETVALVTGSIHTQGEELNEKIKVVFVRKWEERPALKKLISYVIATIQIYWLMLFRFRSYEIFFVSLPPWGYLLSLILPHRCSMVIWDVYPDVFKISGMKESHPVYRLWKRFNQMAFGKAYRLFTIGETMAELLTAYVQRSRIIVQPIWAIFQRNEKVSRLDNPFVKLHGLEKSFVVQYSGNIGLTHRVEVVVALAELMRDDSDVIFQIIGRGPRVPQLQKLVSEKRLPNCHFLPFQSDEMFPFSLSAADIGVVILDELTSRGSVPSKAYNLMSFGIPALYVASIDSELNHYANKFNHAFCCTSQQLEDAKQFILRMKNDRVLWQEMSTAAELAAGEFRRDNADKFVSAYLAEKKDEGSV